MTEVGTGTEHSAGMSSCFTLAVAGATAPRQEGTKVVKYHHAREIISGFLNDLDSEAYLTFLSAVQPTLSLYTEI